MLGFKQFIMEASKGNLHGSIDAEGKTLGHVRDYVMPYLSSAGRTKTVKGLQHLGPSLNKIDASIHGEKHNPEASSTHALSSNFGEHKAGTQVKVTHVSAGGETGKQLFAHTEAHGKIPLSKLQKPAEIRAMKKPKGVAGFGVETGISKNLGTKAAGSSATGFDFHYTGQSKGKKPVVRGVERFVESGQKAVKGVNRPDVRGESKLHKGKFGQSTVKFNKDKAKWEMGGSSKMNPAFEKATVTGKDGKQRKLLDHLNTFHKNGVIQTGFTANAAPATSRHYLNTTNVNTLHIHRREVDKKTGKVKIDHGTTYTVGDTSLKGKTNLSHLSNSQIDRLDGKINVQASGSGSAAVVHRPNQSVMREFAGNAHGENSHLHGDLTNQQHAVKFKTHVDRHIAEYEKMKK